MQIFESPKVEAVVVDWSAWLLASMQHAPCSTAALDVASSVAARLHPHFPDQFYRRFIASWRDPRGIRANQLAGLSIRERAAGLSLLAWSEGDSQRFYAPGLNVSWLREELARAFPEQPCAFWVNAYGPGSIEVRHWEPPAELSGLGQGVRASTFNATLHTLLTRSGVDWQKFLPECLPQPQGDESCYLM